jgi:hypothetical protein
MGLDCGLKLFNCRRPGKNRASQPLAGYRYHRGEHNKQILIFVHDPAILAIVSDAR